MGKLGERDRSSACGSDATLKNAGRRASVNAAGWRNILLCCIKPPQDEIQQLDYQHCCLNDVPPEVIILFPCVFSSFFFLYKNCPNFGFYMKTSQNSGFYRQNLIFWLLEIKIYQFWYRNY